MKRLNLSYVGHVTTLTGCLSETCITGANTLRQLIAELGRRYPGFGEVFIQKETGQLSLCAMIYYGDPGRPSAAVVDLDQALQEGARVTFW